MCIFHRYGAVEESHLSNPLKNHTLLACFKLFVQPGAFSSRDFFQGLHLQVHHDTDSARSLRIYMITMFSTWRTLPGASLNLSVVEFMHVIRLYDREPLRCICKAHGHHACGTSHRHNSDNLVLWKTDVTDAYRLLPVHPHWQLKQIISFNGRRYADRRNTIGSRAGGALWIAFMSLVT